MNKSLYYVGLFFLIMVLTLGFDDVFLSSVLLFTIPFFLNLIPSAKGYENVWVFLIVLIEGIPVNSLMIHKLIVELDIYGWFATMLMFIVCLVFVISFEEIILGFITRKLYPKQKRVEF